jgi:hypothetical protein
MIMLTDEASATIRTALTAGYDALAAGEPDRKGLEAMAGIVKAVELLGEAQGRATS